MAFAFLTYALLIALFPFHVFCLGLLALCCQDVFAKQRITIRSLFVLTAITGFELALIRLIVFANVP